MPLPPRGDPQRPLFLAVRSTRLLGILMIAFSLLVMTPMMYVSRGRMMPIFEIAFGLIYLVPGILYFLCAIFLKRRQFWAIVLGLVLASIQLLLTLLGAASLLAATRIRGEPEMILLGVILLFIAAFVQLIVHLSKSFEAIKYAPIEQRRGFEPTGVQPIPPTKTTEQS
jgi:hypothetical protein